MPILLSPRAIATPLSTSAIARALTTPLVSMVSLVSMMFQDNRV
ncbi:hypothetical protein [Synechococcus sp. PCC 7335]|nr:hypothetical protein [Synechococcus sp. PCC 7335]